MQYLYDSSYDTFITILQQQKIGGVENVTTRALFCIPQEFRYHSVTPKGPKCIRDPPAANIRLQPGRISSRTRAFLQLSGIGSAFCSIIIIHQRQRDVGELQAIQQLLLCLQGSKVLYCTVQGADSREWPQRFFLPAQPQIENRCQNFFLLWCREEK